MELVPGQLIELSYQGRAIEAIIINPHAFGKNSPSIGLGYRMQERCAGISHATISNWVKFTEEEDSVDDGNEIQYLRLPKSKKQYPIYNLVGETKRNYKVNYKVIEVKDFIDFCLDILAYERVGYSTKEKLKEFLAWFTFEGFYAQAYTVIKGAYYKSDSEELQKWLLSRLANKAERKPYARFIVDLRENPAFWTNYTYIHLFGKIAQEMREHWKTVDGLAHIARNHIPQAVGLEAVGYVERMVCLLYTGNLQESHDLAIKTALLRFELPKPEGIDVNRLFSFPTHKLSPQETSEIQELYLSGSFTQQEIALAYRVTSSAISYHCKRLSSRSSSSEQCA